MLSNHKDVLTRIAECVMPYHHMCAYLQSGAVSTGPFSCTNSCEAYAAVALTDAPEKKKKDETKVARMHHICMHRVHKMCVIYVYPLSR